MKKHRGYYRLKRGKRERNISCTYLMVSRSKSYTDDSIPDSDIPPVILNLDPFTAFEYPNPYLGEGIE